MFVLARDAIGATINALTNDKSTQIYSLIRTTFISHLQTNWRHRADFREEARD